MENKYNFHGQPIEQEDLIYELSLIKKYMRNYVNSFCKENHIPIENSETLQKQIYLVFDAAINMIDNTINVKKIYPDKIK